MCARSNHASDLFVILSAGRRKCCCSGAPTPTTQGDSRERPYRMDLSASANCRPDDASANCRPKDSVNGSSRLLPRLVQQPPDEDRHVDVPGICASNLESVYQLGEVMGKGSFAVVKTARRKTDGKMYAIKILEKTNPGENEAGPPLHPTPIFLPIQPRGLRGEGGSEELIGRGRGSRGYPPRI